MTNQQAPEIYALHTVHNKGERPWSGIYAVRADAEHDAKVLRDATGRDWSVVRLVVADTATTPSPTPPADSQPAADEDIAMSRTQDLAESGRWPSDWVEAYRRGYSDRAASAPADSVTAPAGGADWQDISTAPKDGTRFVAVGQNYGLDSEAQHTCIAQRLAGCWVEVSDWNGASKLKYLTHWMPLPPLPCSAARKQGGKP